VAVILGILVLHETLTWNLPWARPSVLFWCRGGA
jgi:hypothetical protein